MRACACSKLTVVGLAIFVVASAQDYDIDLL